MKVKPGIYKISDKEYIKYLEGAVVDMLDAQYMWYDIKDATGLSEERCKEIENLYLYIREKYQKEYGI